MKTMRYESGFAAASLILSTALAIDWLGGMFLQTPLVARCGMLGLAIMMSGSAVLGVISHSKRSESAIRRYFSVLCKTETLSSSNETQLKPPIRNRAWLQTFHEVRDALAAACQRTQELEAVQTASEIRARRSETKARCIEAILAGLPEPVLAINEYDELILSNASANQLLEIDLRSTEERALARLVQCERLVDLLCDTQRRKGPSHKTTEVELSDETGRPHCYSVTARSICMQGADAEEDGSQVAVAVLRDISTQKAAQRRNAEFVSAVSHEMKTPLAGIKAYTELMIDGDAEDEETRDECLQVISGQANRLQRLVENLLNLARIEAGVVAVSKQSRPLTELLGEALGLVQPSAELKRIALIRDLSPMYLGVLADRDMLLQAAINLLSNAIKYTPPGGRVTLRSRLADAEVWFEVEDTGVGLSEEDCQKVFEKFYRVQGSKDMAAGTGLGLALAKHIVEDVHGGRLSVSSQLGRGSTFRITLPSAGQIG